MEPTKSMDELQKIFRSEVKFNDLNESGLFNRICGDIQRFTEKYKEQLLLAWFAEHGFAPGRAVIVTKAGLDGTYRLWIEESKDGPQAKS
jgi:hypothetical protein